MRQKHKNILPGFFTDDENETKTPKIVRLFREEYKRLDEYLKKYPEITELAHRDLMKLCKPNPQRNRTPDFTTENLFRAVLVMQTEAVPYFTHRRRVRPATDDPVVIFLSDQKVNGLAKLGVSRNFQR